MGGKDEPNTKKPEDNPAEESDTKTIPQSSMYIRRGRKKTDASPGAKDLGVAWAIWRGGGKELVVDLEER